MLREGQRKCRRVGGSDFVRLQCILEIKHELEIQMHTVVFTELQISALTAWEQLESILVNSVERKALGD